MTRKQRAILLSALVLPGLGQLYLGRKIPGIIILLLVNLLLLLGLFVVLKALSPVLAAKMTGDVALSSVELMNGAIQGTAGFGKGLLVGFLALWGCSIADILRNTTTEE